MGEKILLYSELPGQKLFRRGKVRDVYDLGDQLLIIATDRISCFDVVLPSAIPQKGRVLTEISCFWFDYIQDIIGHHLITSLVSEYPAELQKYSEQISGRSMLVKKSKPLPVECIVRGYLSGSGWKEYQKRQSVCGIKLPPGLLESDKLPEIIFTPSTKEEQGHDINVSQGQVEQSIGKELADKIKNASIAIYKKAADYALSKGIIIADTKFEFGLIKDNLILIDEVLTPDSSRFWPQSEYQPGKPSISFDKQFVRDYLAGLNWDMNPPAPQLPEEIIVRTSQKYLEAFERLTGRKLG